MEPNFYVRIEHGKALKILTKRNVDSPSLAKIMIFPMDKCHQMYNVIMQNYFF
jgi:hypothetical protein